MRGRWEADLQHLRGRLRVLTREVAAGLVPGASDATLLPPCSVGAPPQDSKNRSV